MGKVGAQVVFWTATLGPADMEGFCRTMGIRRKEAVVFCSATTRQNV